MFDQTITLFNRYSSRLGDTWYPTVIHGCEVDNDRAAILARYGAETKDNATIHVKTARQRDGGYTVEGKRYLTPKLWENQVNDDLPKSVTFEAGAKFDFIYVGEWPEDPVSDEAYMDGFYDYMNAHYDGVYAITSVAGPFTLIPHFEIMGR